MSMIIELTQKVKTLFSEKHLDRLARATGLIKRKKKIVAKDFLCHHLCLGLNKEATIADIAEEFLESSDILITKQAIHKKYTSNATDFMRNVLEELMGITAQTESCLKAIPFVQRVKTVDSSNFKMNKELAEFFPGLRNQKAGVKLQTVMDVVTHTLYSLDIRSARENDQSYKQYLDHLEERDLSINDLGYFCVDSFKAIQDKNAFFLSRFLKSTAIYSGKKDARLNFEKCLKNSKKNLIEKNIRLGAVRLPCRVVAIRLPSEAYQQRLKNLAEKNRKSGHKQKSRPSIFDEWTVFVTNLPSSVSSDTLLTLYSLRWQIELFFKAVKTCLNLRDISVHHNAHRVLIALYSSLIVAVLLTHCFLVRIDKEISLYKSAKKLVKHIKKFISLIDSDRSPFDWISSKLSRIAIKETSPKRPTTKGQLGVVYA